jgi:hypothetical protein
MVLVAHYRAHEVTALLARVLAGVLTRHVGRDRSDRCVCSSVQNGDAA